MPIQTKLTISTSDFQRGLKNAENQAKSAFNSMSNGTQAAQRAIDGLGRSATSSLGKAGSAVQGMTSALAKMGPVGLVVAGVFAGVSLAVVGAYKGITSFAEKLDGLAKNAKSIGLSFNGMLATKFAAGRAGNDFNRTIDNIQKLTTAWEKATQGEEKYIKMFKELGVDLSKDWLEAPERLYGSVTSALASGRSSSALTDLLGRRGMREASKSAANGFEQDLSLAATLGLEVNEGAVAAAERLMTAQGQLSDGFIAMLGKVQLLTSGMDALAKVEERLLASTNAGKPLQEGVGYENIYNIITRALDKDLDQTLARYLKMTSMSMNSEDAISSYVQRMSSAEKDRLKNMILELPAQRQAEFATRFDARINPSKQETWVQKVEDTRTEAEKAQANAYAETLFHIRGGAQLEEELNSLKQKQIQLTQEQIDTLEDEVRNLRQTRWENTFAQVSKDRRTLNDEQIKQMLGIEGFNENALKYIESTANALLGEHGLTQLFTRHGGTAENFIDAYQRGSLFTPYAEDVLSEQTKALMKSENLSLNEEGIRTAEAYIAAQAEAAKASQEEAAQTRKQIDANIATIASLDAKRAAIKDDTNTAQTFGKAIRKSSNAFVALAESTNDAASKLGISPSVSQEKLDALANEKNVFESDVDKLSDEFTSNLSKAVELTDANAALEEQAKQAEEAAAAQKQAAEDMQKAVNEMRKYYEFSNIDKAIQKLLGEAEAIDFGKLLNAQVDARKAAEGQYDVERTRFSSGGNSRKIAEAQAEAMMKAAGLTITPGALKGLAEDIYRNMQAQAKVGIQRLMQNQLYANEDWQMSKGGARGAGLKAVADAVRAFGDTLSQEQKNLIGRSAELKYNADNWRTLDRKGNQFATNELTSRGGFRTGVVQTQRDNIKDVLANQKRYIQIMESMHRTNQDIARLLTN